MEALGIDRSDREFGFHIFRHSLASNAAAAGVRQEVIDSWLGHQTEEMRRRYRHLFPKEKQDALQKKYEEDLKKAAKRLGQAQLNVAKIGVGEVFKGLQMP